MFARAALAATTNILINNNNAEAQTPTSNSVACNGFKFEDDVLDLGSSMIEINKKTDDCICGRTNSGDAEIVITLTNPAAAGVKTIILTSTLDSSSGLTVTISISNTTYGY